MGFEKARDLNPGKIGALGYNINESTDEEPNGRITAQVLDEDGVCSLGHQEMSLQEARAAVSEEAWEGLMQFLEEIRDHAEDEIL